MIPAHIRHCYPRTDETRLSDCCVRRTTDRRGHLHSMSTNRAARVYRTDHANGGVSLAASGTGIDEMHRVRRPAHVDAGRSLDWEGVTRRARQHHDASAPRSRGRSVFLAPKLAAEPKPGITCARTAPIAPPSANNTRPWRQPQGAAGCVFSETWNAALGPGGSHLAHPFEQLNSLPQYDAIVMHEIRAPTMGTLPVEGVVRTTEDN
jgi:hypothetical protein